jgi:hypothetical protein
LHLADPPTGRVRQIKIGAIGGELGERLSKGRAQRKERDCPANLSPAPDAREKPHPAASPTASRSSRESGNVLSPSPVRLGPFPEGLWTFMDAASRYR